VTGGSSLLAPDCAAMNARSAVSARLAAVLAAASAIGLAGACSSGRDTVTAPPFGTVEVPPVTIQPFVPPISGPDVAVDSVAMIGDSITAGSQDAIEAGLGTLGLDDVEIDAVSGRRMLVDGSNRSGLDAVEEIAESDPPDLWVIALGTNDVGNYRPEEYGPAVAELLGAVPQDAPLIWVDTYLDARPAESAAFNDVLRLSLAARGRSMLLDWSSIAAQDGVLRDGVHPSDFGVQAFSDRVVAAVDAWSA
jgi:lysophospholipase L1-like esterase